MIIDFRHADVKVSPSFRYQSKAREKGVASWEEGHEKH
jgi:hypothetical protein